MWKGFDVFSIGGLRFVIFVNNTHETLLNDAMIFNVCLLFNLNNLSRFHLHIHLHSPHYSMQWNIQWHCDEVCWSNRALLDRQASGHAQDTQQVEPPKDSTLSATTTAPGVFNKADDSKRIRSSRYICLS